MRRVEGTQRSSVSRMDDCRRTCLATHSADRCAACSSSAAVSTYSACELCAAPCIAPPHPVSACTFAVESVGRVGRAQKGRRGEGRGGRETHTSDWSDFSNSEAARMKGMAAAT